MAFGYGVSVTPLQLAHAYSAIAADGILRPISFLLDEDSEQEELGRKKTVEGERVMSAETAQAVRKMMQRVISDGTGKRGAVANYSVAGKTGTVHKFIAGGYAKDRYLSIFSGMVPADNPELVMVVVINEPRNGEYFGGLVAAPVFSAVMSGAMRLLDVAPDRISDQQLMSMNRPVKNLMEKKINQKVPEKTIAMQVGVE
jgi:cell division protein FtsI (penicillin-binding protein 3)